MNRRSFLKSSAIAAGAVVAAGDGRAAESRPNASGVAGYDYRLPSFRAGSRLVFLGDSITDMNWGRNESDRNHYLGHSFVYLIASRLGVDMPQARLEFFNRGHSGERLQGLKGRWQKDAIDMNPDLVSILIGVNDVQAFIGGLTAQQWEADYRFILEASRQANPDVRLVLLDPFVLASGRLGNAGEYGSWRGKIDVMLPIVAQLAKDYQAVHVRTQAVFDAAAQAVSAEQWIWDGVHPLPQGHELIARNWLEEVSARWR